MAHPVGSCRRFRPHPQEETRARSRLVDELHAEHGDLSRDVVVEAVSEAWEDLADATVRLYVPELARRSASERLRALTSPPGTSPR